MTAVATIKNKKEKKITEKISFSKPIISEKNEHTIVSLDETDSFIMKTGYPMLPVFTKTFTFPFGTKIKSVTCEPRGIKQTIISKDIQPAPAPMIIGSIKAKRNTVVKKKADVYNSVNPYPNQWYNSRVGTGLNGNDRVVFLSVEIYPTRCIPAKNLIEYASSFEVTVNREEPAQPITFDEEHNFVILTPDEFSDELQNLIDHKNNMRNIPTRLVTLEEIYNGHYFSVEGRDNPEKIKYFIKNAVETWNTSYVLLVGGSDKLPTRETHIHLEGDDEIFVSDLYYADIYNDTGDFCSWDSNGNDNFAEYNWNGKTDNVDLYPDVHLGRLACVDSTEVNTCVNKIITYETNKAYAQDWFTNLVVCGGDSFTPDYGDDFDHGVYEGELVNNEIIEVMDGFIPNRLNTTNSKIHLKSNVDDAIEAGAGFIDFSGHGNPGVWATHDADGKKNKWVPSLSGVPSYTGGYSNSHVDTLSNGDKLPIVVIGGCSCSKFNARDDCFGWSFISNENGGGIATLGATGLGYVYINEGVTQGLVEGMAIDTFKAYRKQGAIMLGEMWAWAINSYIKARMDAADYKTIEEWQPFGDPTLQIQKESQPPLKPETPSGESEGKIGEEYIYSTVTTDPDGDDVYYRFDWGDETYSNWLGPYESGETCDDGKKTWDSRGNYQVRVQAKDTNGKLSEWSDPLPIIMAKNNALLKIFLTIFVGVTLATVLTVLILWLLQ